jgi:putative molybdopterin biosynthesis protein
MMLSSGKKTGNRVRERRLARGWAQAELAQRAGISRAAVSAIEGERLTPSVAAALALAGVLECSVEELFGRTGASGEGSVDWAWRPRTEPSLWWEAEVGGRFRRYPVEALGLNPAPQDGVWHDGICRESGQSRADATLTLACCDPAAGLLAAEYARLSGFRLLVFPRGGRAALDLVRRGLVHVAGLHRSTAARPERNAETVRTEAGSGYQLLRAAQWEEGLVLPADDRTRSVASVARSGRRWAAREPGSAARECLDELLSGRRFSGHEATGHAGVAEAVRAGWAGAGVCVQLCAVEAGLNFLPVRTETLDFCFTRALQSDPRIQALVRLLRSRAYQRLVNDLPGYDTRHTGELTTV